MFAYTAVRRRNGILFPNAGSDPVSFANVGLLSGCKHCKLRHSLLFCIYQ